MANVILSQTTIQLTEGSTQQPTYTIALDPPPTQPVTVTLRTDGQSQINVDEQGFDTQHTVVFSGNLEKTVTVRVNDDGTPEGVHPGTITHTVTATEDEENYPLNTELTPVSLDITDNDPGLYIQGTPTPIEGGENGTYEFGLSTAPDGNVTVQIETTDGQSEFSLDGGNTFFSSREITFTPTNFTTEITVQGIQDNILEGNHSSTITHTITQSQATQPQYSQDQTRQINFTITDNNPDLLTFDNQILSIEEGQEDGTYTIKADGLDADITVTIKANGSSLIKVEDDQAFASEQMITLNSTTSEKTITVQAAEDSDVTGPQTVSISHEITNSNSSNFPRGKVGDVTVNIADNDPGVIITQPTGQILEGEENEYTIALSTNPDGPVTITLESDDNSDIKLPDGSGFVEQGTITLSDTTPQTIKVQATEDSAASEGTHESTITHTITAGDNSDYPTSTTIDNATVQIIDDSSSLFGFNTAPFNESDPQKNIEDGVEEGNEGNYTLRLEQPPGGDVIVTIQADDQSEISIDGGSTFAASQDVRFSDTSAKTITVKPIDDSTVEGSHTSTITHTITDAPDGSVYKVNSNAGDVIVNITDNDPGLIITPATEPTEEGGDLTTYEVALSTTPTSPVRVTITTDGESELALDEGNLNFGTSRNIELSDTTPTTVTVRGTTDDDVEGLHTSTLTHEITDSTDPNYPERRGTEFTTIDIKDGTPGVIISNQSLSVSEGQEGTYTISLTTEPTQDVTVTITADEQGLISVDGEEFASEQVITLNQSTLEKEIKVQAVDDDPPEGIHSSIITHSIASDDTNYSNENTPIDDVTATITDNDIGIVIIGTPQVTEGSTDTYEIGLSTQPTGDVTVTITADNDDTEISVDGTNFASSQDVTFSNLTLQTITVRVENDEEFKGLRDRTIKHAITESQDNTNYPPELEIPDVTAEITDDEPGVVIISNLDLTEGEIGTYEIGLNTPPVGGGSVTVTITADPQTTISTDGNNFNSTQTIQLEGTTRETIIVQVVDDTAVEGEHKSTISHEITGSSDPTNYPLGQEIDDVTIDITDNDPGLIFSDAIAITEGGDEGTYTVALNTVPTGEVTVTLTADDDSLIKVGDQDVVDGEFAKEQVITLNPEKLQETISVQAVDDDLVEGTHTSTISHAVTDSEDTTNYPIGISGSFSATITDDDPGIVFSETTLSAEEGQEDTYTIGLSTVPTSDVTVTITADDDSLIKVDDGEFASEQVITLNAETLEKEITVQGLDDDQVEGDHTSTISHEITASEDPDYPLGELEQEVTVNLTDNDSGLIFSQAITITENNGSGTYTVSLNTPPTGEVQITIEADDQSTISLDGINFGTQRIITLNPTTLEETITVRATQDALVEGVHTSTISHTVTDTEDPENYPLGEGPSYTANIVDDDPGIVFIDGPVSVQEGQEGIYTVALSTRPTGDVTVKLTADDQSVIKVDGEEFATEQEITFNAETLEKEITVQPVDDNQVEGDHTSQISYEVTVSEDENYTVGLDGELTTNITDPAQVVITPISPLEEGELGEYTIALNSVPAGAVEITITADENSEISLDGQTFDNTVVVSLEDTTAKTITVQALDDDLPDGEQTSTISYEITSSGDLDKYPLDLDILSTEITITDNDAVVPGQVNITEIAPLTEAGESQEYTIALDTEPAGPVEITITADDNSEISLDGETFSNEVMVTLEDTTAETITVQAVDDDLPEGDHTSTISYEITSSGDLEKYPLDLDILSTEISITDNDADGVGQVNISEISGLTEGGESQEYTIALDTEPAGPVEITITADENSEISLDGETFSNEVMVTLEDTTAETITVQAVDDDSPEGDHTSTISYEITSTEDSDKYPESLNIPSTEITITDNDPVVPGQVNISEIAPLSEGGESQEYTIALDTEPAGPVEITITADDDSEISLDGETFSKEVMVTLEDTTAETITVQAVDDDLPEGDHTSTISYEITSSGDLDKYPENLEIPASQITITDNDADDVGQVLISEISGLTEGGEPGTYTIALDTEPAGAVEIKIMADEDSEISLDGQTFSTEVMVTLEDTTPTTITVMAVDDDFLEGDHNTTISYEITSTGDEVKYPETLNIPSTEITITDNESVTTTPEIIISESPILFEGGTGIYTVALTKTPTGEVEITIKADDQTEISLDGSTFASEQVLTFNEAKLQTITVRGLDDQEVEGDHESTISHEITQSEDTVNYPLGDVGLVTASIFDNDIPIVTITASDLEAAEKDQDPGSITITRSGDTTEELTVNYMTFGSTATADDYSETLNGSVTIAAGESSVELKITPEIDFLIDEGDETVNLILNTSQDYNLVGNTFAQITIADDTSSVPDNSTRFVWNNPLTGDHILWKIDATKQVTTVTLPTLDLNFEIQGSGDLNGNGDNQDVFLLNTVTGAIQYWQVQGEEINEVVVDTGEVNLLEWEIQEFADFDGDSKDDILAYKADTGEVAILTIDGETLVNQGILERDGQPLLITPDTGWQIQGAGNFNGDDGPDQILWHNQNTGEVGIWEIDGNELADAAFVTRNNEPVLAPSSTGWQIEGVADFTGDGQQQILWYNSDNGYIATWQMSNKELVEGAIITRDGQPLSILPSEGWTIQGVADVNQDGQYDILWNNDDTIAVWELDGSELTNAMLIEQQPEAGFTPNLI